MILVLLLLIWNGNLGAGAITGENALFDRTCITYVCTTFIGGNFGVLCRLIVVAARQRCFKGDGEEHK